MKKLLELKNQRLLAAIRSCKTRHFKHWTIAWISDPNLRQFVDEVSIIKGKKPREMSKTVYINIYNIYTLTIAIHMIWIPKLI